MPIPMRSPFLLALPLLTVLGCDVESEAPSIDEDIEWRLVAHPLPPLFQPYHGRWQGAMTNAGGVSQYDYDATILLAPSLCTGGATIARAEWDYYNLGLVCTSELELLEMSMAFDGTRTWTYYDSNVTGPCTDGLVDLTETDDPTLMEHTWRDLGGVVDATGFVSRIGLCGSEIGDGN